MPNLILSRNRGEEIIIAHTGLPEDIIVGVVDVRGDKVRLSIKADLSVIIMRPEIFADKDKDKDKEASHGSY